MLPTKSKTSLTEQVNSLFIWPQIEAVSLFVQICHVTTDSLLIGHLVGNISEANYQKDELFN